MASKMKYPQLTADEIAARRVKKQPWYKERVIETIHKRLLTKGEAQKFLNPKDWTFIKHGMDDFRTGRPPSLQEDLLIRGEKGLQPNINGVSRPNPKQRVKSCPSLPKHVQCFSKTLPGVSQRRSLIDQFEQTLHNHPLGVFSYYEDGAEPETFEEIVSLIDPAIAFDRDSMPPSAEPEVEPAIEESSVQPAAEDSEVTSTVQVTESAAIPARAEMFAGSMKTSLTSMADSEEFQTFHENSSLVQNAEEMTTEEGGDNGDEQITQATSNAAARENRRNPYCWIPRLQERGSQQLQVIAEEAENMERVNEVTKDFCEFIRDLGGEKNNIEESTIHSLFASGYETKPALNVPIHVVDFRNIPPELRGGEPVPEPGRQGTDSTSARLTEFSDVNTNKLPFRRFQYGAWYLPKRFWSKRDADQPLMDPAKENTQEVSDTRDASIKLDEDLAQMYGANSFLEYMRQPSKRHQYKRMPHFLKRVDQISQEVAEAQREAVSDHQNVSVEVIGQKN